MFSEGLKLARDRKQYSLKELAALTGIDQTLLSRFERGDRIPTEKQFETLNAIFGSDIKNLRVEWMAEKILKVVSYDLAAREALKLAETRIEYLLSNDALRIPNISSSLQSKLDQLSELRDCWNSRQPLGPSQAHRMKEALDTAYTFESNRIEGNTLTLHETAMVVVHGLTIGGKSMREHLEAINHAEAIDYLRDILNRKEAFSKRVLMDIHRLVLKGVDSANAGIYRNVPVRISGTSVVLPVPHLIDNLMDEYFDYYRMHAKRLHPVLLAADMHERLVSIHPFIDGNGRTARLVMNLILMGHGYTRANIKGGSAKRLAYFQALESVQLNGDSDSFYHLVVDECIESLEEHLALT